MGRYAIVCALLLFACKLDSPYFGPTKINHPLNVLYVGTGAEPEFIDPGQASDSPGIEIIRNLFEGLHYFDRKTAGPTPGVATSYKVSDDGLKYTFYLRNDAKWSDGRVVTAHDFVFAWRRNLLPELASQYAFLLHDVKNGQAVNEGGLSILEAPAVLTRDPVAGSPTISTLAKGALIEVQAGNRRVVREHGYSLFAAKTTYEFKFDPDAKMKGKGHGGAIVTVLAKLDDEAVCNGKKSAWFRVKMFGKPFTEGFLPACLMTVDPKKIRGDATPDYELVTVRPPDPPAPATATAPASATAPAKPPAKPIEGWLQTANYRPAYELLGVKAADDFTLDVELERPVPFFIDLTQFNITIPLRQDVIEQWATRAEREIAIKRNRPYLLWTSSAWTRPGRIVSNGPFNWTKWAINDSLELSKNAHYWDVKAMKLDRVVSITSDDDSAMMILYQGGLLDWPGSNVTLPPDFVKPLSKKKDYRNAPYLGSYFYWVNVKAPGVQSALVRRALNMAINKEHLVKYVLGGGQTPSTALVPPGTGRGYEPPVGDPYNLARAKELLAEAGFPGGKGLPKIELSFNTNEGHRKIAEAIHQMWKRDLGIDIELVNQEWKVFLKNLQNQNYQIGRMGWIGDFDEPFTFLSLLLSNSGQNHAKWKNSEFDQIVDKGMRERDRTKRYALYRKAEEILLREMPVIPIYIYRKLSVVKPYVRGIHGNIQDIHPYKYIWLDPLWASKPAAQL